MTGERFEKTFTVAVPVERAWRAFADSDERSQWEASRYEIDARPGGRVHWQLPGVESTGEVVEVVEHKLLRHVEGSGPHANAEITVEFESVDGGTRITITHAGFGSSEDWHEWLEGTSLGWRQAIADLVVHLTAGVPAGRFVTAMSSPGMTVHETDAGIVVETVSEGGLADQAQLRPGDLVLRVGGTPVFSIGDLWVLMRVHAHGTALEIEYIREGTRRTGTGVIVGGW